MAGNRSPIQTTASRAIERTGAFHVGKADQNNLLHAVFEGGIDEIPKILRVRLGKKTIGIGLEENSSEMDDYVYSSDGRGQSITPAKVGTDHF